MAGNVILSINVIPRRADTAINVNSATMPNPAACIRPEPCHGLALSRAEFHVEHEKVWQGLLCMITFG